MTEPSTEDWKIIQFGRYKGKKITDILNSHPSYCKWLTTQSLIMEQYPKFKDLFDLEFKNKDDYFLNFGKHKNKSLIYVNNVDKKYTQWLRHNEYVKNNLPELVKALDSLAN